MPDLLQQLQPFDWLRIALGVALLVVGRRLYWLALAGLGFAAAIALVDHLLTFSSDQNRLIAGAVAGVLGAFVAITAQKLAVAAAGFILGAWAVAELLPRFGPELGVPDLGLWLLPLAALGGLLGFWFSRRLFSAVLILASAFAGATLIVSPLLLEPTVEAAAWLGLFVVGLATQVGRPRRKAKLED